MAISKETLASINQAFCKIQALSILSWGGYGNIINLIFLTPLYKSSANLVPIPLPRQISSINMFSNSAYLAFLR